MEPNPSYKTKRCRHFDMGRCKLGGLCNFAHGSEEVGRYRDEAEGKDAPEDLSKANFKNNSQKILALERNLEEFTATQRSLIQSLKQLTQSLESSTSQSTDLSTNSIEDCLKKLSLTSLKYSDTLEKLTLVKKETKSADNALHPEEKLSKQISFLISKLKRLHSENAVFVEIVTRAERLLETNIAEAALELEKLIYNTSLDRVTQTAHKNLLEEARRRAF